MIFGLVSLINSNLFRTLIILKALSTVYGRAFIFTRCLWFLGLGEGNNYSCTYKNCLDSNFSYLTHITVKNKYIISCANLSGGGGGIRTHGTVSCTPVFKTGALNRSTTPPKNILF